MNDADDAKLSALYRRAPADEPDARVDDAIRRAAHDAVKRRPSGSVVPWAVAATLVLAVGIGWQTMLQTPPQSLPSPPERTSTSAVDKAASPAPTAAPAEPVMLDTPGAPLRPLNESEVVPREVMRKSSPVAPATSRGLELEKFSAQRRAVVAEDASAVAAIDCRAQWLDVSASSTVWRSRIDAARQRDDTALAECLQRRYRQLFDESGNAINRPARDK